MVFLMMNTRCTQHVDAELFPPNRTRRRPRCMLIYLSSQPVLPSQVTDRRLGTAAVEVLVTWMVGVVLWADLSKVWSGRASLLLGTSTGPDLHWGERLRVAYHIFRSAAGGPGMALSWWFGFELGYQRGSFGSSGDHARRCMRIRWRYRHHRYDLYGILCIIVFCVCTLLLGNMSVDWWSLCVRWLFILETYWLRLTRRVKVGTLRAVGPCLLFVGPPHGYCMKLLGASTFVGYFIVLFCVMVSYHICDCGNLKSLSPDVQVKWPYAWCLFAYDFCCTPVVHGAYFEGSVNVPWHICIWRLVSYSCMVVKFGLYVCVPYSSVQKIYIHTY